MGQAPLGSSQVAPVRAHDRRDLAGTARRPMSSGAFRPWTSGRQAAESWGAHLMHPMAVW